MKNSSGFTLVRTIVLLSILLITAAGFSQNPAIPLFNPALTADQRIDDLLSRMTVAEKISQMQHDAPAIERLGIPAYNWWNECLHGVARNGIATVFPQAIGMAATFNPSLIFREAEVISTEARAKYAEALSKNEHGIYQGLTFWSPNINIFRDPRWGRGQETYGEDPFLTAEIGKAFVRGLQGSDPNYFKVIATAKHFAVHSGPEPDRHRFDAWPSMTDLYNTYLPAFEALVTEAGVQSVMSSYNRLYATPASASDFLLQQTLRDQWGFKGYVVSDCWAVSDFYKFHNFVKTPEQASALAVHTGCDIACGNEYVHLNEAIKMGFLTGADLDRSLRRLFYARLKLGMFDPPAMVPYSSITPADNNTPAHRALAAEVARQSIVLLKNSNNTLPLSRKINSVAVIGPYANDTSVLLGNYNGIPTQPVTLLQGIFNQMPKGARKVTYNKGVEKPELLAKMLQDQGSYDAAVSAALEKAALQAAATSDAVVFCGGISPNLEGEEMDVKVEGFSGGDRTTLGLPASQVEFLRKLHQLKKPVILVLTNGSALSAADAEAYADAVVEAWYPGEEGGNAVAEVLFGAYNPAGRLPVTFYNSVSDLPAFDDYSMKGRTYRYFEGSPLHPFGYGLSYTSFAYSGLKLNLHSDTLSVVLQVQNTGKMGGDEVVQVYVSHPATVTDRPLKSLAGVSRQHILPGRAAIVELDIPVKRLRYYNGITGEYEVPSGIYRVQVGASSADIRLQGECEIK